MPRSGRSSPAAGDRVVLLEELKDLPETLALAPITYSPTRVLDGIKSLSYASNMLASRLAKEQGADEALLITPHGRVLEGPTTALFYALRLRAAPHAAAGRPHPRLDHPPPRHRGHRRTERTHEHGRLSATSPRRSWPRRCARSTRSAGSSERELPAPGPLTRAAAAACAERIRASRCVNVVTVIGNRPQFVKAAAVSRLLRERARRAAGPHRPAPRRRAVDGVRARARRPARPSVELGDRRRHEHRADRADAGGARAAAGRARARIGAGLRRHELDARRRAGGGAGAASRSRTSRPACGRSTARMPEELNRVLTDHAATCCCARRRRRSDNLRREGVAGEVVLVGDVMVDIAQLFQPRARASEA